MKTLLTKTRYTLFTAAIVLFAASSSQAQTFTSLRFTPLNNQVFAVPTTYVLLPRYRPIQPTGPETWQVRLRTRNGSFTRSYRVANSALAIQRSRREYPNATLIAVRKV